MKKYLKIINLKKIKAYININRDNLENKLLIFL